SVLGCKGVSLMENVRRKLSDTHVALDRLQGQGVNMQVQQGSLRNALSWHLGLALFAIGAGSSAASAASTSAGRFERLNADFERTRQLLRVPGLAVAVVEGGRVVWHREIGLADLEGRLPVTEATEFCIASVTKTMAAIVLLQMVHERRLRLDNPVSRYVEDPS